MCAFWPTRWLNLCQKRQRRWLENIRTISGCRCCQMLCNLIVSYWWTIMLVLLFSFFYRIISFVCICRSKVQRIGRRGGRIIRRGPWSPHAAAGKSSQDSSSAHLSCQAERLLWRTTAAFTNLIYSLSKLTGSLPRYDDDSGISARGRLDNYDDSKTTTLTSKEIDNEESHKPNGKTINKVTLLNN